MTLFFSLLPIYIFGNFHCLGMCGPLVMLIGKHRFRVYYLLGRLFSFTLAGFIAGELGAVLHVYMKKVYFAETLSLILGVGFVSWGILVINKISLPIKFPFSKLLHKMNQPLSMLILKDSRLSTFLFGFFTVFLPCGQTLIVFSACALAGDALIGLLNGFALALLTSPSLLLAMSAQRLFPYFKARSDLFVGISAIFVGVLAVCRGMAEIGWISHWTLNEQSAPFYHIILF